MGTLLLILAVSIELLLFKNLCSHLFVTVQSVNEILCNKLQHREIVTVYFRQHMNTGNIGKMKGEG